MRYTLQIQRDAVAEAVRARYAMIIPIVRGMLYSTKRDMVERLGGYEKVTFEELARIYVEQPGDYGICFEYAVHDSLSNRDAAIHPIVSEVLEAFCRIGGGAESILFGIEKSGRTLVVQTAADSLTDESRVLVGKRGQPARLKKHLQNLVKAFKSAKHRERLPQSIRGLWKADLFVGSKGPDQWVATTLKTNRREFEAAPGLRIGLYPDERGEGPHRDEATNLIMCPLPYNGDFMQLFGASFQIAKQLIANRGEQPGRVALVYQDDQAVAKWFADRRRFPVLDMLEALEPLKQPGLLEEKQLDLLATAAEAAEEAGDIQEATAPIPQITK